MKRSLFSKLLKHGLQVSNLVNKPIHHENDKIFNIEIVNIINYYNILCAIVLFISFHFVGHKIKYLFIISAICSFFSIFILVSSGRKYAEKLIFSIPLVTLIITTIYMPINRGIAVSLLLGLFIIFLFLLLLINRKKEILTLYFISVSGLIFFFGSYIINLLIHNKTSLFSDLLNSNLKSTELSFAVLILVGLVLVLHYGKQLFLIDFYHKMITIEKIQSCFSSKRISIKIKKEEIKEQQKNLYKYKSEAAEYSNIEIINEILFKKDDNNHVLDDICIVFQNFFSCNHIIIYQKYNFSEYQILTHYYDYVKKNVYKKKINPNSVIHEVEYKKKSKVFSVPSNYFVSNKSNYTGGKKHYIYVNPIVYQNEIFEFLEFSTSKLLTDEEKKRLDNVLVLLARHFKRQRYIYSINIYEKALSNSREYV